MSISPSEKATMINDLRSTKAALAQLEHRVGVQAEALADMSKRITALAAASAPSAKSKVKTQAG